MSKTTSRKDVMICFRTSEDLRKALENYAVENNRSLSSTIESVLSTYLKKQSGFKGIDQERRRYLRKSVNIPAFINALNTELKSYQSGVITDISLSGLKISIPKDTHCSVNIDNNTATFEVIFALPEEKRPLNVQCKPQRFVDSSDDVQVSAAFVDSDFKSYQLLQKYLI